MPLTSAIESVVIATKKITSCFEYCDNYKGCGIIYNHAIYIILKDSMITIHVPYHEMNRLQRFSKDTIRYTTFIQ